MITANFFSHSGVRHSDAQTKRAEKMVKESLLMFGGTGSIHSASGFTAALAINICETKGWPYMMVSAQGRYYLKRIEEIGRYLNLPVEWHKISERTPPERQLLMVTGKSGMTTHTRFLTLAYYDNSYRPPIEDGQLRWLNVQNDALLDQSWRPTHWANQLLLPSIEEME